MKTLRALAAVGLFALPWVGTVHSEAPRAVAGRLLGEVLQEMASDGVALVYSNDLVQAEMRVRYEPSATSVHGILEQLLGPHELRAQIGPNGLVLIVSRNPTPIEVTVVSPQPDQPLFGDVGVMVDVISEEPISKVIVLVNGERVAVITRPPYATMVDVGQENVDREITVQAEGAWGGLGESTVTTSQVRFEAQVDVGLRQLYVAVSRGGQPVVGLNAPDFSLWDDGEEQNLVTFGGGDIPLTAALLLDVSQSMQGRNFEVVVEGSRAFLAGMREPDRAMVMMFSDRTLAITPFSPYRDIALSSLQPRRGASGTALTDHLYASLRLLEQEQGRRVVILVSDGDDVSSLLRMEDVGWKVRRGDAMIYWIKLHEKPAGYGYSSAWRGTRENRRERKGLQAAIRQSGGRIVALEGIEQIGSAFDEILSELRAQYVLGYYPRRRFDGSWREVKVQLKDQSAEVTVRPGYVDH